jgi:hypothetical protein
MLICSRAELDIETPPPRLNIRRVEVPLNFDAEFFDILQADVTTLDDLQAQEQKAMGEEIVALSREVTKLARRFLFSMFHYLFRCTSSDPSFI